MHWKRYFILLGPAVLLCMILLTFLPRELKIYTVAIPFVFWGVYYTWVYMTKIE